jgi:predicted ATP-grasp superfamily ATP-dependent carboligase
LARARDSRSSSAVVPRVLVTDASRGSAISIIRSLGRRGYHVIAADSEVRSPGFYSRYASERLRYPPSDQAPGEAIATLLEAARERRVDLIVPVTDDVVLPLSKARERFAGTCALALPERRAFARTCDKLATLELAAEVGVPAPRTALVATVREAIEAAPSLGWPVVLKPRRSRVYRDGGSVERYEVSYAQDAAALAEEMRRLEGRSDVLLQKYYRGEGQGVELLTYRGRPLAAFQHRRLREVPITGGASSFRESVPLDPVLYDYSVRLLAALEWTGLAMVEFKLGKEGPRLMEINGRIWGSLPLAVKSGMDFPARMAELYLRNPPEADGPPDTTYALGVRSRNLDLEILWIGSALRGTQRFQSLPLPGRRQALAAALRLLYPGDGFDVLARDDPRPGMAEIARIAAKLRRKLGDAR